MQSRLDGGLDALAKVTYKIALDVTKPKVAVGMPML